MSEVAKPEFVQEFQKTFARVNKSIIVEQVQKRKDVIDALSRVIISRREMTAKNKCSFCEKELTSEQEVKQGLCGNCYDLRRIIRRIQKEKRKF